jgi:CTP:molybdopterin cytidylyltransferase MocA
MTSYLRNTSLELDTVILLACDQPFVDSSAIASLVEQRKSSAKPMSQNLIIADCGDDVTPPVIRRDCRACGWE